MGIMLGNLSVNEIQNRLSISFTDEEISMLNSTHQGPVDVPLESGCWHCFDIPFMLVCDSMETAISMRDMLKKYEKDMKGTIQIGIDPKVQAAKKVKQ